MVGAATMSYAGISHTMPNVTSNRRHLHFSCSRTNQTLPVNRYVNRGNRESVAAYAVPSSNGTTEPVLPNKKKVVVVGAGWAGFGAVKHLAEQGYDVMLIDASPNPGGLSAGWRTPQGKAVEAGFKGFWYQYHNIFKLVRELDIPWPFTDWTPSGFWSPRGLTTEAPVFSQQIRLPTMLGQFVWTAQMEWSIPLPDRLTMFNMLYPVIDYDADMETYGKYDQMSAYDLFRSWGMSKRIYEDFLKPTCLIGLFAPPESLSAGAVLGAFYFYALAHQADFDVCWCKGSVAEKIFAPLMKRIAQSGGKVMGSQAVTDVLVDEASNRVTGVVVKDFKSGQSKQYAADAVVFAVGVTGMQKIVSGSPVLGAREEFRRMMNLSSVDVIATRLWLDKKVDTRYPANVLSGFEGNVGATFFNLNELQDEYKDEAGSVIAADYYHAGSLLPLTDDEIVQKTLSNIILCEPGFRGAKVVDSAVLRFPKAVTHFSPGSWQNRPYQKTSFSNLFMAGDWAKAVPHGANGLSQERAYVTGLLAANMVISELGVGSPAEVLDTEEDEEYMAALKNANKTVKNVLSGFGLSNPLL